MSNKIYVGKSAISVNRVSPFEPYSKVVIVVGEDESTQRVYEAGDDSGLVLEISNPWGSQAVANNILAAISGFQYQPFSATGVLTDLSAELGDGITIDGIYSILASQTINFSSLSASDIEAPTDGEIEHEYSYESSSQREIKRRIKASANAVLEVTDEAIRLKVSKGDISSEISAESGGVSIRGGRLTVESDNFKLSGDGTVTASGSFTASRQNQKTVVNDGGVSLYYNNAVVGRINGDTPVMVNGSASSFPVMNFESPAYGITFSDEDYYYMAFNTGLNPSGSSERLWLSGALKATSVRANTLKCADNTLSQWGYVSPSGFSGALTTSGDMLVQGDFLVQGTKNRIVATDSYGSVTLNAIESTSPLFADMGSGTLDESGVCFVYIDPVFFETIDYNHVYQVFLSQTGPGDISYAEKGSDHFLVRGTPGTCFDWAVFAKQKGYSNYRLEPVALNQEEDNDSETESIFWGDSISAVQSERYMREFGDNYDELARLYLEEYEREVNDNDN